MRNLGLIFSASLLFHLAGTWILPLLDRDEPRFAEASREMLERGDYIIPYFNGRYRFDKPPLTYWFQTLSYRVFGENDFAARFPSAVAAALTAVVIFVWARRIGTERVAWWATLFFTLCLQTFVHARAAVADMWLVLFVTLAHWAGYELLQSKIENRKSKIPFWWLFYLALAFAFLAKGPIGWTPFLALVAARFYLPSTHAHPRCHFVAGSLLILSVVALWGIPALLQTNGEFYRIGIGRHVVERSFAVMEGHGGHSIWAYLGGLPFYFAVIFLTFFPWSFKLPWLARHLWNRRDTLDNYLLIGIAVIFLLFTVSKTKLPHYTLPAFPLLALLLARALANSAGAERFVRRATLAGSVLALLAFAAHPFAARLAPAYQLSQQARADLTPQMEFGGVDYREPSLVWYFRKYVKGWFREVSEEDVAAYMQKAGGRFVVMPTDFAAKAFPVTPGGWKRYETRGFSPANFKWVELTMLLKPL